MRRATILVLVLAAAPAACSSGPMEVSPAPTVPLEGIDASVVESGGTVVEDQPSGDATGATASPEMDPTHPPVDGEGTSTTSETSVVDIDDLLDGLTDLDQLLDGLDEDLNDLEDSLGQNEGDIE